ncbi:ABC transporter permease [Clostridium rectalis]|uniref:ABC transporter permease n=1 Tax=Clostridium rectalis TaxID=2040295 RepID=UPI000F63AABE|nr:ABC transporter permease [Clostridium rectalis]
MKKYNTITFRYLKGQKKRTILTILGIVLAVALISAIGTMLVSIRGQYIESAIKAKGHYHAKFMELNNDLVNKLNNNVEIEKIAVVSDEGSGILSNVKEEERVVNPKAPMYRYLNIEGYDNRAFEMLPIKLKDGRLPRNENEILLEYWALDYLPLKPKIGDKIKLVVGEKEVNKTKSKNKEIIEKDIFNKKGEKEYKIVGTYELSISYPGGYNTKGITFLNEFNILNEFKYSVFTKMVSPKGVHEKCERIANNLELKKIVNQNGKYNYNIEYNEGLLRFYAESINESLNRGLTSVVVFIVVLIIISTAAVIYNIFNISVLERVSQFGILRCTGAAPNQIKGLVLKEAFILSLIGIPLGLLSGILAMEVVIRILGVLLRNEIKVVLSPVVFIISALIGLITIYLSVIGPARKAAKVSPLEAVRNAGSFKKENIKKVKKSRLANKIFGIEGEIAYKNLKRNRKKFRITVFSLIISIVLYVVFGSFATYVYKFGAAQEKDLKDFVLWKYGQPQKEISLSVLNDIQKFKEVEKTYAVRKESRCILVPEEKVNPRMFKAMPFINEEKKDGKFCFRNNNIISYGDKVLPELKKYIKEGAVDIEKLNNENGVILLKTSKLIDDATHKPIIMDTTDYKVGDYIDIIDDKLGDSNKIDISKIKKVKVLGILDKGVLDHEYNFNESVSLITSEKIYKNIIGNSNISTVFIQLKEGANKDSVASYLKVLSEKDPRYNYIDHMEESKKNRDGAIAVNICLYGFVVVISLIGALNIINTISTNLILRKRELAMLRAVGMNKSKMTKMVCLEGIYYGIIASIYGGIIGTALSYRLFKIMTDIREFQWAIPKKEILTAVVGVIIISLASTYIPLRKINRENIIENIRGEE